MSNNLVGGVHQYRGDLERAGRRFDAAVETLQRLVDIDPANTGWRYNLAVNLRRVGMVRLARGDARGALAALERDTLLMSDLVALDANSHKWRLALARSQCDTARARLAAGDAARAQHGITLAMVTIDEFLAQGPDDRKTIRFGGECLVVSGEVWDRLGAGTDARRAWERAVTLLDPASSGGDRTVLDALARALLHLGRDDRARPIVDSLREAGYRDPSFEAFCRSRGL